MNYARIYPQARSFHAIHNCSIRTGYSFLSFNIFILFTFIIREKEYYEERKIMDGQRSKIICDKHLVYR